MSSFKYPLAAPQDVSVRELMTPCPADLFFEAQRPQDQAVTGIKVLTIIVSMGWSAACNN